MISVTVRFVMLLVNCDHLIVNKGIEFIGYLHLIDYNIFPFSKAFCGIFFSHIYSRFSLCYS